MGLTAVLHTYNRRLDYYLYILVVLPGGGINQTRKQWKKLKGKYLFNGFALAKVYRARLLPAFKENHVMTPLSYPSNWGGGKRAKFGQWFTRIKVLIP